MLYYIFKLYFGGDIMPMLYATMIIKGRKTFDEVPDKVKDEVKVILLNAELDENGYPL